jgi:hypothetical protein
VKPPITDPARADNAEMYAMSMSLCRDVDAKIPQETAGATR